jgi:hypothetical protein
MIIRALLIAIIIGVVLLGLGWVRSQSQQHIRHMFFRFALYLAIAVLIGLAVSGRLHWLIALLALLLPFVQRLIPLLRYIPFAHQLYRRYQAYKSASNPPPNGQTSSVNSRFVHMTLNHDDGQISGTIMEGPYRQRQLHELSLDQLLACLLQWQQLDEESARLLSAYLDQTFGTEWRAHTTTNANNANTQSLGEMNHDEAIQILGLKNPLTREDVIAAHRRLMQKMHPDRGGSNYLATIINQAKDLLLAKIDSDH